MENETKGYRCPCCNSFVKTYKRKFNSNMAVALIVMYRTKNKNFIKVEDLLLKSNKKRCGDFSYLRHYGFIEKLNENRLDGSSRNGFYRILDKGVMFVENKVKVPESFLIKQNELKGFVGKDIGIIDALGNKFNYNELLQ